MSWSKQVHEVAIKANKIANVIYHAFASHSVELYMSACFYILCKTYHRLLLLCVESRVMSGQMCWQMCCDYSPERFSGNVGYHVWVILIESHTWKWKVWKRRRFVSSLTMFYNIYNKFVICDVLNDFTCPSYLHNLCGHSKKLLIPFCRSIIRKQFF
jgi:hypothetical protein